MIDLVCKHIGTIYLLSTPELNKCLLSLIVSPLQRNILKRSQRMSAGLYGTRDTNQDTLKDLLMNISDECLMMSYGC